MTKSLRTLILLACSLPSIAAFSAEHRIKSAADLEKLCSDLRPGDNIVLANGTWADQALAFRATGTEEKPITLRAETPGQVVLTGTSRLLVDGAWLVVDGLQFKDGGFDGDGIALKGHHNRLTSSAMIGGTYKFFVHLYGIEHRVDHCYFAGKTSDDPTFQIEVSADMPNHNQVDHNHFGPRPPLGRNGGETLRIGYSHQSMNTSGALVEWNLFDRCDGEIEIISSKSCDNTYRYNTFLDCAGMLTLRHGNRCVVDSNFFIAHHKKGSGGIRVIGEDHVVTNNYIEGVEQGGVWITAGVPNSKLIQYFQAQRCLIAFNTIVDSQGPYLELDSGIGASGRMLRPKDITIANNLFSVPANGRLLKGTEGEGWRWLGNLVAGASTEHAGIKAAELKLVRGADGLWRPGPGSPARGAAEGEFPSIKTDIDGQPRTGTRDSGCDQASTAPAISRPLTASDVGPVWLDRGK